MRKITSWHHRLQTNSSTTPVNSLLSNLSETRFHKRPQGLEQFIPSAALRETYMVIRTWMNLKTRTCFPGLHDIAEKAGVSVRTIQRHIKALHMSGVLIVRERRIGHRSNLTHFYTFPLLNEDFLRSRVSGGGCQNVTVIQVLKIKEQTTTARVREKWKPDRETYRPRTKQPGARMSFREAWSLKSTAGATVGMNYHDVKPVSAEEISRLEAEKRAHKEKMTIHAAVEAEAKRREQNWVESHGEGCEKCEGKGFVRVWINSVPRMKPCKHGYDDAMEA